MGGLGRWLKASGAAWRGWWPKQRMSWLLIFCVLCFVLAHARKVGRGLLRPLNAKRKVQNPKQNTNTRTRIMMQSSHSSSSGTAGNAAASNPDQKVLTDLATLTDQIKLCQSMLAQAGSSIDGDEALLTVIGFLEACVPRMVELIEAAAQGALKPETFEECLVVNDKLTTILSDVDKDPKDRQPIVEVAASASASAATTDPFATNDDSDGIDHVEQGMENMAVGSSAPAAAAVAGGKTTGLDDEDPFASGPDLLNPTPIQSDPFGTAKSDAVDDDDDFDAFFKDRTSGKQD